MSIDVSGPTGEARAEAEKWATRDPTFAELMATCAELGEQLDAGPDADECRYLVGRVSALHRAHEQETDERAAVWWARRSGRDRDA